jgi:hypothetical protein
MECCPYAWCRGRVCMTPNIQPTEAMKRSSPAWRGA